MKIELIHGPYDGVVREFPGTTDYIFVVEINHKTNEQMMYIYDKRDITTDRANWGFVYVGKRSLSDRLGNNVISQMPRVQEGVPDR